MCGSQSAIGVDVQAGGLHLPHEFQLPCPSVIQLDVYDTIVIRRYLYPIPDNRTDALSAETAHEVPELENNILSSAPLEIV